MYRDPKSDVETLMRALEDISQSSWCGVSQVRFMAETAMREQHRREITRTQGVT